MPAKGETAPDFELLNQDEKPVKLSDFKGKKVILFAFPRAATSGCTTQACGFRDEMPRIEADNTVVLGISDDPPAKLKAWQEAENLNFDLLSDPDHATLEAWGAWGEKSMYGKKFMGTVRSHWVIGTDGVVLDEQIKVSPKKSIELAVKVVTS